MEEDAVCDGIAASSVESGLEDEGEGEAEALEHVRVWDVGAEGVEEEGCGGSLDAVGYWILRRGHGGI